MLKDVMSFRVSWEIKKIVHEAQRLHPNEGVNARKIFDIALEKLHKKKHPSPLSLFIFNNLICPNEYLDLENRYSNKTPIVLLGGAYGHASYLIPFKQFLEQYEYPVYILKESNYEGVDERAERICELLKTIPQEKVNIIAHSKGVFDIISAAQKRKTLEKIQMIYAVDAVLKIPNTYLRGKIIEWVYPSKYWHLDKLEERLALNELRRKIQLFYTNGLLAKLTRVVGGIGKEMMSIPGIHKSEQVPGVQSHTCILINKEFWGRMLEVLEEK